MKRSSCVDTVGAICALPLLALVLSNAALAAPVTECDVLAAHPDDEQGVDVVGVPFEDIDAQSAIRACRDAVSSYSDAPRFVYQLGRAIDAAGDTNKAIDMYRMAAEAKHAHAALNLGHVYNEVFKSSDGLDLDAYREMQRWHVYAADTLGSRAGQLAAAKSHLYAPAEVADVERGKAYLTRSADGGYSFAQQLLGVEHLRGQYFPKNEALAGSWLLRAVEQDNPNAQFTLAYLVLEEQLSTVSVSDATELLRRAAEQNLAQAEGYLGEMLVEGEVLEQDIRKGFALLEKAALEGVEQSKDFLWSIHNPYYHQLMFFKSSYLGPADIPAELGPFYGRDSDDALRWIEKLAARDDPGGLVVLAALYETGGGFAQDIGKAFDLYSRAAELDYSAAIEAVERLLEEYPNLPNAQQD